LTEATFDEMDPIMGSCANVRPPLIINTSSTGYANIISVEDDDEKTVI